MVRLGKLPVAFKRQIDEYIDKLLEIADDPEMCGEFELRDQLDGLVLQVRFLERLANTKKLVDLDITASDLYLQIEHIEEFFDSPNKDLRRSSVKMLMIAVYCYAANVGLKSVA